MAAIGATESCYSSVHGSFFSVIQHNQLSKWDLNLWPDCVCSFDFDNLLFLLHGIVFYVGLVIAFHCEIFVMLAVAFPCSIRITQCDNYNVEFFCK